MCIGAPKTPTITPSPSTVITAAPQSVLPDMIAPKAPVIADSSAGNRPGVVNNQSRRRFRTDLAIASPGSSGINIPTA